MPLLNNMQQSDLCDEEQVIACAINFHL